MQPTVSDTQIGAQGTPGKLIIVKKISTLFGNVRMYSIIYNTQL